MDMIEPTKPVRVMPTLPLWGPVGDRLKSYKVKSYKVKSYIVQPLCDAPLTTIQMLLWRRFVMSFELMIENLGDSLLETIVRYDIAALKALGVRVYAEQKKSKLRVLAHGACESCGCALEECECE